MGVGNPHPPHDAIRGLKAALGAARRAMNGAEARRLSRRVAEGAERAFQRATAGVLLVLASPLLAAAALAVFVESGRPVFFGHLRLGRFGRPFRCWKLRTMTPDAEARLDHDAELRAQYRQNGYKLPSAEDPRVTRVGRWLRRTYLDELPQLFNVLNGTMALVGPRPVVPDELAEYGAGSDELLTVKPGIVGEWTSRGPARPPYPERARMELDYVRRRSLRHDVIILARSVPAVFQGQPEE